MVPPFMRNRGFLCVFIEEFFDGSRLCLCGFTLFLPDLIDLGRKFSKGPEGGRKVKPGNKPTWTCPVFVERLSVGSV